MPPAVTTAAPGCRARIGMDPPRRRSIASQAASLAALRAREADEARLIGR